MCSLLRVTPKQLGKLREKDSTGLAFLERSFIHRKKLEYEAHHKNEETSRPLRGRKMIRRK